MPTRPNALFRKEAVEAARRAKVEGALLELPSWNKWVVRFVAAAVILSIEFAAVTPAWDYADGLAIVQVDGRLDVTTSMGGTAIRVAVRPNQHVRAGQFLVGFYTGGEQVDLDRVTREFELKLGRELEDPSDQSARQAIETLRAEREQALARLRQRSVFAPATGIVTHLRVRSGQTVAPGDVIATLSDGRDPPSYSVVGFVPGGFRPMIRPGMSMRLELDGYAHAFTDVDIDEVGEQTIGPTEAQRYFGPEARDELSLQGSLVAVRGHLRDATFSFDHERYSFADGIPGRIRVRVRSMRLIVMLVPYLREVFGHAPHAP